MTFHLPYHFIFFLCFFSLLSCDKTDDENMPSNGKIQLSTAQTSGISLLAANPVVPAGEEIILGFSVPINPSSNQEVVVADTDNTPYLITYKNLDNNKILSLSLQPALQEGKKYTLTISNKITGEAGETFDGITLAFEVAAIPLEITTIAVAGKTLEANKRNLDLPLNPVFEITFSHEVPLELLEQEILLVGNINYLFSIEKTGTTQYRLRPNQTLKDLTKTNLLFPASIGTAIGRPFATVSYELYTQLDPTPKFPVISDDDLLTLVQSQTFKYFWDFGHPVSGLARERNTSGDVVTSGGSGFGLMSMVVAVERGFISRAEALTRWEKIFNFLENADRFHGVWSHWLNGNTGKVIPFSTRDNGGDLVETAFLVQGMLTVRQYLDPNSPQEAALIAKINSLWESVEWDWYTRGGQEVLYWHWSPEYEWAMNLPIRGHNETQIVYTLAAASPTHSIDIEVYRKGYASSGGMKNGGAFYGYTLPLGSNRGGPLFFTHYSYLGMDPRNLQDEYANYWEQNVHHSLINRAYCIDNPQNYVGYSAACWGLTASDSNTGYSAHSPNNDKGVLTPTAALSSMPYTPEESLAAMRHFYYQLGDRLWGDYGFYDAFNPTAGWVASSYLAIDQGPIIIMIENYRTALLWNLYMSSTEVQSGLDKLGFTY